MRPSPAGHDFSFSPGHTTERSVDAGQGPNVARFAYDAGLSTWTAFSKLRRRVQDSRQDCRRRGVEAIHRCV